MSFEALDADQRATASVNGKPSYTIDRAAAQLIRADLSWSSGLGQAATVTYAYRASAPSQMPDDTGGFGQFSASQIDATERALAAWGKVANITFVRVGSGDYGSGAYSNDATILFGDYTTGESGSAAFAYMPGARGSAAAAGDVWVNSSLSENSQTGNGQYGYLTLVHEIGHAIGLSHPSDYDASDDGTDITYAHDASYFEDSLSYTVMSYFDATDTGSNIQTTRDAPDGPLIDDVAAAQRLYGANMTSSTGDDIYRLDRDWLTIWDAGGTDTIDASSESAAQKIDLRPGSFSDIGGFVGNVSIALGTVIENAIGGSGNDTIIGNDADNRLSGNAGNDTLTGGLGNDTYIGGDGTDRAKLGGNTHDYHLVDGGGTGLILLADNGSGNQWIDGSTEGVEFRNGQYLSLGDVHAYVAAVSDGGTDLLAAATGTSTVAGGSGRDILYVDGDTGDYQLDRVQSGSLAGDFVLQSRDGHSTINVGEAVDQIDFLNGQYLSLHDVPNYVAGNATLYYGTAQDDLLFQDVSSRLQLFAGGDGHDDAYLNGNVGDYVARDFYGDSETLHGLLGIELIATNGSGTLFIDSSVDTVHYKNGQYLSFGDIMSYEAPAGATLNGVLHFVADAVFTDARLSGSADPNDIALVDGNASDFTLGRSGGDFVLTDTASGHIIRVAETIDTVEFVNGQYLATKDLGAYLGGSDVYTDGSSTGNTDDLLFVSQGGDQYVIGGGGFDNVYLNGNAQDYTLQQVSHVLVPYDPYAGASVNLAPPEYVTGVELHATNGSGNIYIDQSTESIHFQNGQYLAFGDLPAYIHDFG